MQNQRPCVHLYLPAHTELLCTGLTIILWVVSLFFSCPSSSVNTFRPMQLFLVKVKADRGEQYKVAYRWPLAELKLVDGKTLDEVGLIFLLWQRAELILGVGEIRF